MDRVQISPSTPRRSGRGEQLNNILQSVEVSWRLGLVRNGSWSPSTSDGSLADKTFGLIKRIYWSAPTTLDKVLRDFENNAATKVSADARLLYLYTLLRAETEHPEKRDVVALEKPQDRPPKTLRSSIATQALLQIDEPGDLEHTSNQVSEHATANDTHPESPADEEDFEWVTPPLPPSPTTASKVASRRVLASPRLPVPDAYDNLLRRGVNKRPSDSINEDGTPPKATKISKGKSKATQRDNQSTANTHSDWFDEPFRPRNLTRDFASLKATHTFLAPERSFHSSVPSMTTSFSTAWSPSDYQGQDAANTSFTTDATEVSETKGDDILYPLLPPTSSVVMGSVNDEATLQALLNKEAAAERLSQPMDHLSLESPLNNQVESPRRFDSDRDRSPSRAPAIMQHQVRDLPGQGLFVEDIPACMGRAPFIVLWESCRIALDSRVQLEDVLSTYSSYVSEYDAFYASMQTNPKCAPLKNRATETAWVAAEKQLEGHSLKGKLIFNTSNAGPVFNLRLDAPQLDTSCRFQRKFGSDRFLYLSVPSFNSMTVPQHFKTQSTHLRRQYETWQLEEHAFLGRKWRVFHVEGKRKKKGSTLSEEDFGQRLVLFATEGHSLDQVPIAQFLGWFMPFRLNMEEPFCKAYSRLDLGLSRAVPTLQFLPSQVIRVRDTLADLSTEDTQFNDWSLPWNVPYPKGSVMNDGCALISVGAAKLLWKLSGNTGPIPSAFQGRIGGAKGLWMLSAPISTVEARHLSVWIEITNKQLKFEPHTADTQDDNQYDPHRLTFELLNYSKKPTMADLHVAFVPIMIDRGVPLDTISELMNDHLDYTRAELLDLLPSPERLRKWLSEQSSKREEIYRSFDNPQYQAGLPQKLIEKISFLLESGFSPMDNPYLARLMHLYVERQSTWLEAKLSIPLGKATHLFGVADPLGILEPGEVHLHFSSIFFDRFSGEGLSYLDSVAVLVGRQPACRRSDLQKVRAVFKSELAHLVDVVVFPSKGRFPLAGKLQGGDYDGDTFWICWEPHLVGPFRNAPAPMCSPNPTQYGIEVDKRKLGDLIDVNNSGNVDNFLEQSFAFRNNPTLLGKCTNFHERICYAEGCIYSPAINALNDIHDMLVDASKNGFKYKEKAFRGWRNSNLQESQRHPRVPAYRYVIKASNNTREMADNKSFRKKKWKFKEENPVDHLYFKIMRPHNNETLHQLDEVFRGAPDNDPELQEGFLRQRSLLDKGVQIELDNLIKELDGVYRQWATQLNQNKTSVTSNDYNLIIEQCYARYEAILPGKYWREPVFPRAFSEWELTKASALATEYANKGPFIFHMAGKELGHIKAAKDPNSRLLRWNMYRTLKPRKLKTSVMRQTEDEDIEDKFEDALEA